MMTDEIADRDDADDDREQPEIAAQAEAQREKARVRKAAKALGWKIAAHGMVEIRVAREFSFGRRSVTVRGRVAVEMPDEISAEAGALAVAPMVDPVAGKFQYAIDGAARKILSEPDTVERHYTFEKASFFSAIEDARRALVRDFQDLENKRLDDRIEADLGLRFYLESLTTQKRRFEYFVGPTNSGKTHAALEALRAAESGIYLAPLRLLALEIHERLGELGLRSSLVTGEERIIDPAARHVSSTVEMVDLRREVEVAVVDEAQMLQDEQRGWAWTLAIAGVRAKRVIMCGSQDGLAAAQQLGARLGIELDVRQFERKNPLRVVDAIPLTSLRRGDAVVAFSRNAVVDLQSQIRKTGRTTAAIYGSLSPAVRRREAERFRTGEADVLVATDAIGLGLNLPIRRLVFVAVEKFDGLTTRLLTPPEVRQIAGRAGRYGIHEEGQVTTLDPRAVRFLRASLERFDPPPEQLPIWISPTDEHLRRLSAILGTNRVGRLLQFFQTRIRRAEDTELRIANLADTIEVASTLELSEKYMELPFEVRCTYARAPVPRGNSLVVLGRWGERHAAEGIVDGSDVTAGLAARDSLLLYEDRSRLATLYLWLAQRFPNVYIDGEAITRVRERLDDDIHVALLQHGGRPRREQPKPAPAFRRKGPPTFNKRRLPK